MTANQRIAKRLLAALDKFVAGEMKLPHLQEAVIGHGCALEGLGASWYNLVNRVAGQLESIRFTRPENEWMPAGTKVVSEMREALEEILTT